MNKLFDIKRFGKVLTVDFRKYTRNFGITLAILCGLTVVLWLLTVIFGFTMPAFVRWCTIYVAVFLGIILVPAKAFGDINLPREGVRFAMLPASNLEKYLSYLLFCLLTPIVIILASWGIDSLLTILPFGGFNHSIRHFGPLSAIKDFMFDMEELTETEMQTDFFTEFSNAFSSGYLYSTIVGLLFQAGIFMFGNLLFKTHKTGKTLAVMIGVSYVLTMIMQVFLVSENIYPWLEEKAMDMDANKSLQFITELTSASMVISNVLHTIVTIGLYIGMFFKLKTQKY